MGIANRTRRKRHRLRKRYDESEPMRTDNRCTHPILGVCKTCGRTYCRTCGLHVNRSR